MRPGYLELLERGELEERARRLEGLMAPCRLCPRRCGVDRLAGEKGACRVGARAVLSSFGPHFGEERPISGRRGSGTLFLAGCNLACIFCQNHEVSHGVVGYEVEPEMLAFAFLSLQEEGCHNINLVTPTHVVPQLVQGLILAAQEGLRLPLVYNCGGYEAVETLRLLEGIVDIYMPDFKYWDAARGLALSGVKDYGRAARAAVKEMHRQVGDLVLDGQGVAVRGLLVRHLLLPGGVDEAAAIAQWLAREVSPHTWFNLMDQYRPLYRAGEVEGMGRRILPEEFARAEAAALEAGLRRLDHLMEREKRGR